MSSQKRNDSLITVQITKTLSHLRLDKAMAKLPEIATRSRAARLFLNGRVLINDKKVKPSHITSEGEILIIHLPKTLPAPHPTQLPLNIVFEDDQIIVVDKASGRVVHPAHGHTDDTLVNALIHYAPQLSTGFAEDRPGIVHRLDKDTSGLLVVAKNNDAHEHLALQFRNKTVHRIYYAVVFGCPAANAGRIESHLIRNPRDRQKFCSLESIITRSELGLRTPKGKRAITHWKIQKTHKSGLSLVSLQLETGRTHQIRVHLSENKMPIVGDPIYGSSRHRNQIRDANVLPIARVSRLALHAAELGFIHPTTRKSVHFRSPWPSDLKPLLSICNF